MSEPVPTPGEGDARSSSRTRAFLWTLAAVLALALVIFGISALSSPDEDGGASTVASTAEESDKFYEDARAALESGDTTAAIALLKQAVELDPDNQEARTLLDQLTRLTETSDGDGDPVTIIDTDGGDGDLGDGNGTDPGGDGLIDDPDEGFLDEVGDLATLLPPAVDGYTFGTPLTGEESSVLPLDPIAGLVDSEISRVLVSVYDRETVEGADEFLVTVSKVAYPDDVDEAVVIEGVGAYFGTDGGRLATAVFARGRYVFEVVVTVPEAAPASVKVEAVRVAEAFPDALQ
jgi:hypothetical protein